MFNPLQPHGLQHARSLLKYMSIESVILSNVDYHLSFQKVIVVTPKITEHHKNMLIMEKFEILQELPKCDTET